MVTTNGNTQLLLPSSHDSKKRSLFLETPKINIFSRCKKVFIKTLKVFYADTDCSETFLNSFMCIN